jgi:hypothetical protein
MTERTKVSDREKVSAAEDELARICRDGPNRFRMSIPVRESDSDVVIGAGLKVAADLLDAGGPRPDAVARAVEALETLEWTAPGDLDVCPVCYQPETIGHHPECGLLEALTALRPEPPAENHEPGEIVCWCGDVHSRPLTWPAAPVDEPSAGNHSTEGDNHVGQVREVDRMEAAAPDRDVGSVPGGSACHTGSMEQPGGSGPHVHGRNEAMVAEKPGPRPDAVARAVEALQRARFLMLLMRQWNRKLKPSAIAFVDEAIAALRPEPPAENHEPGEIYPHRRKSGDPWDPTAGPEPQAESEPRQVDEAAYQKAKAEYREAMKPTIDAIRESERIAALPPRNRRTRARRVAPTRPIDG